MKKRRKLEIVSASHVKYDIIKHFNTLTPYGGLALTPPPPLYARGLNAR